MKKKITKLMAALALLAFLAIPMGMTGQTTVTFTAGTDTGETSVTKNGVTVSMSTMSRTDNYRCYANTAMTIESTVGNITTVELTCTGNGNSNYGPGKFSLTSGYTGTYSYSGYNGTWTGSAEGISLTASAQVRMTEIVVTVGGSAPTSFTVTYDANGGTGTMTDSNSPYDAGATVTVMDNTFTRDNYTFDHWNTSADDGGTSYDEGDTFTINANTTLYAQWTEQSSGDVHWVLTSLADLTSTDVFVIVGNNGSNFAMSNDKGTSAAPTAVSVTVANDQITSTVASNIQWTGITGDATNGYTIYSNADNTKYLYCINNNNGVRVGSTGNDNTFIIKDNYIYNDGQGRYLGIFNSSDWRSYTSINNNITSQTFAFYKKVTGGVIPPSISAENVSIEYDATYGSITYAINNEVSGGTISAAVTNGDWITLGSGTTSPISFTCTANQATTARTATVTLTYTYNRENVTKDVTITQAAAPVVYTTIPDLFAAATSTETSVLVTFNNWVVSGVSSNGKNVFVTDNNGNGFVIYYTDDMSSTFAAGNILSGTAVSCTLKKYNGFAELLNVTATDLTITSGGTVAVANVALADLAGVNTGALLHYEGLTCEVTTNQAGTTTYYNLTDGTTSIQVYTSIYNFGTLENGKTYNITGVYQQYNSYKEILPRSADDIEEVIITTPTVTIDEATVTVPAEGGDGTVTVSYTNFVDELELEVQYYEADGTTSATYDWITLSFDTDHNVYYVVDANTGAARTAYFKVEETSEGVASNLVTVNQAAYVAPPTPGNWVLTDLANINAGDVFVIVGTDSDTQNTYALPNDGGSSAPAATAITVVGSSLSGEPADNLKWNLSGNATDGYTFYPNGDAENWLYCSTTAASGSNNNIKIGTGDRKVFTFDEDGYMVTKDSNVDRYLSIYFNSGVAQDWRGYINTNSAVAISFYKKVDSSTATYTLDIAGYEEGSNGNWFLIASPVTVDPATVEGMILTGDDAANYDLYSFDESEENEWRNYKQHPFILEPGKGYLYAQKATTQGQVFHFNLTGTPYDGAPIKLSKHDGGDFPGWNLIGNPFGETAYLSDGRGFYIMKQDGTEIIAGTGDGSVAAMQGIFVIANQDEEEVTFTTTAPNAKDRFIINVSNNRGNVIDRAIVRFGEGQYLPKFQLNENSTKICIEENSNEYAVVYGANEGSMPVIFKAEENGTYTIDFKAENTEFSYLHLVDNMTGADVNLLENPSYSFDALTTDYCSRFKIIYAKTTTGVSEDFAFVSNGDILVNAQGTLQVVDMAGRIVATYKDVNSISTKDMTPGVYVLQLIGNEVRTQKIVVK